MNRALNTSLPLSSPPGARISPSTANWTEEAGIATGSAAWWAPDDTLRRFVAHLLRGEAGRLRQPTRAVPTMPWADELTLDERGLEVDSLDRLQLVAALGEALNVAFSRREAAQLAHAEFGAWLGAARSALHNQASPAVGFRTSGSTGSARRYDHTLAGLTEEAAFLSRLFAGHHRIVSAVPAHHIYGFIFTVLLPQALGHLSVIEVGSPAELAANWAPGDLVIGYPEFWQAVARQGQEAPPDLAGVTSTAPCPAEVAIAVAALGIPLTEIFGSTESAGLGWRQDPDDAFRRFPWWHSVSGEQWFRSLDGKRHVVSLPDHLVLSAESRFQPSGRRDPVVQVGGINVSTAEVRDQLMAHPAVLDAAVRLMRPDEGHRLKAFVVPRPEVAPGEALRAALMAWLTDRLPAAQRPRAITLGQQLPQGSMGKLADWDTA